LTHIFRASPACLFFLLMRCSKASNGGFSHFLSCPRSFFLSYLSSLISSSNDSLSLASLHVFYSFVHFDPITVTVSSTQFTFSLFFLDIFFLPYPRANRPPTITCGSSRGTSDPIFLFYFASRLRSASSVFCSLPPLHPLCRMSLLFIVPSFNCTWYLEPFLHASTESCEVAGCHSTTSTDSHSLILPSILPLMYSAMQLLLL
jgi:hypothetical protein